MAMPLQALVQELGQEALDTREGRSERIWLVQLGLGK